MLTIALCLRSGGDFRRQHLAQLAADISGALPSTAHRFVAISDELQMPRTRISVPRLEVLAPCVAPGSTVATTEPLETIELDVMPAPWPGWWSVMEIYKLPRPWLYLDLDTVIVNEIESLVAAAEEAGGWTVLDDFYRPGKIGFAVQYMTDRAINGLLCLQILRPFLSPGPAREVFRRFEEWGPQGYLDEILEPAELLRPSRWQDIAPGRVISYKAHIRDAGGKLPGTASIVCYHGKPRPWDNHGALYDWNPWSRRAHAPA